MQFEQTYPGARVLLMEENYRSTPEILRAADAFIRKNHHRRPKTIHPTRASGAAVRVISAMDRADQYSWLVNMAASVQEETAVLYRHNDSALPLIDLLDRGGIHYRCRRMDDAFFTHRIVADIRDIIALAHDQTMCIRERPCAVPSDRDAGIVQTVTAAVNAENPLEGERLLLDLEFRRLDGMKMCIRDRRSTRRRSGS